MSVKVVKLSASNILRLTAVEITPQGDLVIIGGPNGAGKSSVLNSIAMALGGAKLVPDEPIHGDASEGSIEVDLGEFVVIRKFKRERILDDPHDIVGQPRVHWGQTKSSLIVRSKENATYGSPQAMLDKLVSKLSFDPLEFSSMRDELQYETLKTLVKLDTSKLDQERASAYNERTTYNREEKRLVGLISTLKWYDGAPAEEVSVTTVSDKMLAAERARQVADDIERKIQVARDDRGRLEHEINDGIREIEQLKARIEEVQKRVDSKVEDFKRQDAFISSTSVELTAARAAVPDLDAIREELSTLEQTNQKVRANRDFFKADRELKVTREQAKKLDEVIQSIDEQKAKLLGELQFPIPGLGFGDGKVTFNGLPLKQASTAEQLRISVAIGIALHPELKVLLIRRGSDLDSKSLAAVTAQAEASGTQIWLEKVAESKDGVTVMIEDGHVV